MLFFIILGPTFSMSAFALTYGRDLHDLKIYYTNDDSPGESVTVLHSDFLTIMDPRLSQVKGCTVLLTSKNYFKHMVLSLIEVHIWYRHVVANK